MIPTAEPHQPAVIPEKKLTIAGSHVLRAADIVRIEKGWEYLARDPSLWHNKRQHDPLYAPHDGWFIIRRARQARTDAVANAHGD